MEEYLFLLLFLIANLSKVLSPHFIVSWTLTNPYKCGRLCGPSSAWQCERGSPSQQECIYDHALSLFLFLVLWKMQR